MSLQYSNHAWPLLFINSIGWQTKIADIPKLLMLTSTSSLSAKGFSYFANANRNPF